MCMGANLLTVGTSCGDSGRLGSHCEIAAIGVLNFWPDSSARVVRVIPLPGTGLEGAHLACHVAAGIGTAVVLAVRAVASVLGYVLADPIPVALVSAAYAATATAGPVPRRAVVA